MKYILLPVLASLFSFAPVLAQYRGGTQDGYSLLQTQGTQNQTPGIYAGGIADGHASALISSMNASPAIYLGGGNDGVAFHQSKGFQNVVPEIYVGGTDDGFSLFTSRVTMNSLPSIYSGGVNDGVAMALGTVQNSTPPIYFGGVSDGVDMAAAKGPENATPSIYLGGGNDGDAEDGYSFVVSLRQNPSELPPIIKGDRVERLITLVELSGSWFNDDAVLAWNARVAGDIGHFELQRSGDGGKTFQPVGNIDLNPEGGRHQEYRYTDVRAYNLPADYLLYRLKSVDKNGGFSYSAIVRLTKDKSAPVIVAYPNPTSGRFTLALLNVTDVSGYGYVLTSPEGKILKRGNITEASMAFDLSGYAAASYHLFLFRDGKSIQHFTILLTQ